jgi:hypothetical protein
MSNPNKAKGTAWETEVTEYLNDALGHYRPNWKLDKLRGVERFVNPLDPLNVKRQAQAGAADVGDLWAWPFIIECKDVRSAAVPAWLRQAEAERINAGFAYGAVAHKTRNANVRAGRVHLSIRDFTRLRLVLRNGGLIGEAMASYYGFTVSARGTDTSCWRASTSLDEFANLLEDVRVWM